MDAVMRFSRICRKVSTKLNKIPLQLRKRFCNWTFSQKKIHKEFFGSVESSYDKDADFFRSKIHFLEFFKKLRSISERKYQTVKKIFRKETISLKKFPRDRPNAFLTIGWRFIAKVWQFSAQEPKKNQKHFFSKKKSFSLNTLIWAEGRLFDNHPKKRQKNWNSAENLNIHWIFFRKNMCFPKSPYGSAESSFDNCADSFLPNFVFVVKNFKKTALGFWEKLPNSLVSQEKKCRIEKLL